ncbi:MAG: S-layer homology domain-containing protein [Clostridia bacterium]|nr:S-layer homology domain-containing protein [Clostridia bacterium]
MKKGLVLFLLISVIVGTIGGISISANLGSGAQVIANNVKLIKTGLFGQKLVFSDTDFKTALTITNFKSVKITSLPSSTEGTLIFAGRRVSEGQEIRRKHLGSLVFIPASADVSEAKFTFKVDGGDEVECVLRFINKVNMAPKAEASDGYLTTQASIPAYGMLAAEDPEGDDTEFIIVSYPKSGVLSFTDDEMGKYKYEPGNNFVGYDSFCYVVRDEYGNYSKPVEVNIKVVDRLCSAVYVDMTEREEYGAAVAMTAMGIMCGNIVGDDTYFSPDVEVSRAEFVAMAMKSLGIRADSTIKSSYFDDNGDIPASLVGYVATAQRAGIVNGTFDAGKLLFRPNEAITKYEAASIMSLLLNISESEEDASYSEDSAVPMWARSSVSAMTMLGILDGSDATGKVTRADAAEYLYKMNLAQK